MSTPPTPEPSYKEVLLEIVRKLQNELLLFILGYAILLIGVVRFGQSLVVELKALLYLLPLIAAGGYVFLQYQSQLSTDQEIKQAGPEVAPEKAKEVDLREVRQWVVYAERYSRLGDNERLGQELTALKSVAEQLAEQAGGVSASPDDPAASDLVEEPALLLIRLALALGDFLLRSGHWDDQIRLASWAYIAAAALTRWEDAALCAGHVIWPLVYRGIPERAEAWAGRMAQATDHFDDKLLKAQVARLQGLIAYDRLDYNEARPQLLRALQLYQSESNIAGTLAVLSDLGKLEDDASGPADARLYLEQALELAEQNESIEYLGECYHRLGYMALDKREYDEAQKRFEQALEIAERRGNIHLKASAHRGLAWVLDKQGDTAQAYRQAQLALEIERRIASPEYRRTRDLVQQLANELANMVLENGEGAN
jgi:tetratricopeptide (TPR) repeat protein